MDRQKWEYLALLVTMPEGGTFVVKVGTISLPKPREIRSYLDEWGEEGWEVATSFPDNHGNATVILKRPVIKK